MSRGAVAADVFRLPGFAAFWAAGAVSEMGSYVTTIALQVLVLTTLHGTALDVGLVNGSRWLPYLLLGLVIGALVERRRRRPLLVATDLGRGILLGLIPLLAFTGRLDVGVLMAFVALFGLFALVNDAADQAFLPRLVPRDRLLAANARIDQSSSVAQTSGPAIGGFLVTLVGAPAAVVVDAVSYVVSAALIASLAVDEPVPAAVSGSRLRHEIGEGVRWVYAHPMLAPAAFSTHVWFVFSSLLGTTFVPFVLLGRHLSALELGLALSAAGIGGLVGSSVSTRLGVRFGAGRTIIGCRVVEPVGWAVIACAPGGSHPATLAVLIVGQALFGLGLGASNANEMGYRQAVTPDRLQVRVNTTNRSVNRGAIVLGAPLGGLLADSIGYRPTLWIGVAGLGVAMLILACSRFRTARHGDPP